jgi:hypothetical protein
MMAQGNAGDHGGQGCAWKTNLEEMGNSGVHDTMPTSRHKQLRFCLEFSYE